MAVDEQYTRKLLAVVGQDREKHSLEEVRDAEVELSRLSLQGLAGAPGAIPVRRVWALRAALLGILFSILYLAWAGYFGYNVLAHYLLQVTGTVPEGSWRGWSSRNRTAERLFDSGVKWVRLPAAATREDAVRYGDRILAASHSQGGYSSDDLQVDMLASIGERFLDVLLERACETYVDWAIERVTGPEDRAPILEAFQRHDCLAAIIVKRHWEADARETLIRGIRQEKYSYSPDFIQAVAALKDPGTYPFLIRYLERAHNGEYMYDLIRGLPDIDRDGTLTTVVRRARMSPRWTGQILVNQAGP